MSDRVEKNEVELEENQAKTKLKRLFIRMCGIENRLKAA